MSKSKPVKISVVLRAYKKNLRNTLNLIRKAAEALENGAEGDEKLKCLFTINKHHQRAVVLKGKIDWARRQQKYIQHQDFRQNHLRENEDGSCDLVHKPFVDALQHLQL